MKEGWRCTSCVWWWFEESVAMLQGECGDARKEGKFCNDGCTKELQKEGRLVQQGVCGSATKQRALVMHLHPPSSAIVSNDCFARA